MSYFTYSGCNLFTLKQSLKSLHSFSGILFVIKSSKSEPAVAVFAEAGARGAYYAGFFEHEVEEFPAGHAERAFEPDVRGVDTAGEGDQI